MTSETTRHATTVVRRLISKKQDVAVAESLTGGLLAAAFTATEGSSEVFVGGIVAYLPRIKATLVGVDPQLIEIHGVVSTAVAEALASGVRVRCDSQWGIGTTGVAGPAGHGGKPPGTVAIGLAGPGGLVVSQEYEFDGDRENVRVKTVHEALKLIEQHLTNETK